MAVEAPKRSFGEHARPPFWRDITIIKWVAQVGFLVFIVWLFFTLISQAASNLEARDLPFSWDFLGQPLGVQLFEGFNTSPESGLEALAVGMVNMLRITVSGIIAATILGTLIGISRLSSNFIVSKVANAFIEFFRNIPLLVQIFFWQAVIQALPILSPDQAGSAFLFASSKGLAIPWLLPLEGRWQYSALLIVGAVVARIVFKWRVSILENEGRESHAMTWSLVTFTLFLLVGWWVHPVMGVLGWLFGALAWVFDTVPLFAFQLVLAALSAFVAWRYIKKYLDDRRTPAGLARLTDDDYFKLILAGILGLAGTVLFLTGTGQALVTSLLGRDLTFKMNWGLEPIFSFLADKFAFHTGAPLDPSLPAVNVPTRFAQYSTTDGKVVSVAFGAVWIALVLYTSAFIGEIVRAGIMAVPKGQSEAGNALGLRRGSLLRLIVLPQAFRIVLPPIGSQYLNLAKNTSLGIAVAFPDIVQVGQTIYNQEGQAMAVFLIWMAFYSLVSLVLSAIVNYYNRKLQLVER